MARPPRQIAQKIGVLPNLRHPPPRPGDLARGVKMHLHFSGSKSRSDQMYHAGNLIGEINI
jgi:hypothetical protein